MFKADWAPFNGMAHRPWLMFWGLILCIAAWAAGLGLCIAAGYNTASETEATLVETSFTTYTAAKGELHLSAADGKTYTISYYKHYNGIFHNPSFLCSGDSYTIWVSDGGYMKAMNDSAGQQIITFESEREAYRNSQKPAVVLMTIVLFLTIAFFVLALVVSKNPEWYPRWLVKFLFANASDFWS